MDGLALYESLRVQNGSLKAAHPAHVKNIQTEHTFLLFAKEPIMQERYLENPARTASPDTLPQDKVDSIFDVDDTPYSEDDELTVRYTPGEKDGMVTRKAD